MTDSTAQPPATAKSKCLPKFFRKALKILKSSAGLTGLLILYIVLGGLLFSHLETTNAEQELADVNKTRTEFLENLRIAAQGHNWTEESRELLEKFEENLRKYDRGVTTGHGAWTILRGVSYSISIITTIGYGHITPVTFRGRLATVLYAIPGIPLCLMVLADLGRLVTRLIKLKFKVVRRSIRRLRRHASTDTIQDDQKEHFNFPAIVAITILLVYLISGSALYMYFENWTYADSVYFLFVSVSTIGLGDLIPQCQDQAWFLVVSTLVVFVGLSLVSMVINVIMEWEKWFLEEAGREVSGRVYQLGARVTGMTWNNAVQIVRERNSADGSVVAVEERENTSIT